jgi:putative FmdB family regulatory protein
MPEYEYRCRNCQQTFSIERSMHESADGKCTHCDSADTARIWGVNFVGTSTKKGQTNAASTSAASGMCESNPAQSKSCCPCSGS